MHKPALSMIAMCAASAAMLASPLAEAGRLGSGRSSGMSRSYSRPAPTPGYSRPQQAAPQPYAPQPYRAPAAQPQQRSGPGWGGVAAGAAAGAAAGYLLGQSGSSSPAPAAAPAPAAPATASDAALGGAPAQPSSFPWGMLFLLGGVGLAGFYFLRRKSATAAAPAAGNYAGRGGVAGAGDGGRVFRIGEGAVDAGSSAPSGFASAAPSRGERLPDGTDVPAFLRQAKASFMHLQTMNSPDNIDELRKYLTPELYESIKADVLANQDTAEFPSLQAEVVETGIEGGHYIATVRFSGMVSESVNAPEQPFEELWHFIKPTASGSPKWLVAGIQQI